MQTPPLFVWLGWSVFIIEYHLIYNLSSMGGVGESKNVSDCFNKFSIKVTLTKSLAAMPLRFQWQKFIGTGLISMSPDCDNSKLCKLEQCMTRIFKSNSFKQKNILIIKKRTEKTEH